MSSPNINIGEAGFDSVAEGILAQTAVGQTGAVVHRGRPAQVAVNPTITAARTLVVVKRSYTTPARVFIRLGVSSRFQRDGTLTLITTPTSGDIRFFDAERDGTQFVFTNSQRTFTANELRVGVRMFAEAVGPSSNLNDFRLRLSLAPGPTPVGPDAEVALTAVQLTLDVSPPRASAGAPLTQLPQPPATPPAPGSTPTDKWFGGVVINAQDRGNNQRRAQLLVGQVTPSNFTGRLVLRQVRIVNEKAAGPVNRARLFDDETPGPRRTPPAAETARPNPFTFNTNTLTAPLGREFFIEGAAASAARRDTAFQLGINGVENDGDRVAVSVAIAPVITAASRIVVRKKPHTNPERRIINVRASAAFSGTGTLTRSPGGPIRLFDRALRGTEVNLAGTGRTLSRTELTNGINFFAESLLPSGSVDDYTLTLTLAGGTTPVAPPATLSLTAVDFTLDIAAPRTAPGVDPPVLSAADKINPGRALQLRRPDFLHRRAMLIVRRPDPLIAATLELTPLNNGVEAFTPDETPAAGQVAVANPHPIPVVSISPNGSRLFAQGVTFAAGRISGFRLGLQGVEVACDRVVVRLADLAVTNNRPPFNTPINRAEIEGMLRTDEPSFNLGDLFGNQRNSLFRIRLELRGVTGNTVQVRVTTFETNGTQIEPRDITLTRQGGTDRFVSLPTLAIPFRIPRAGIAFRAPQDIEVIRASAGGTLRVETLGPLAGVAVARVAVRGRVLNIRVNNLSTSNVLPAEINSHITLVQRTWAQAGIEVRQVGAVSAQTDPGGLDNIEQLPNNFFNNLGTDRQTLFNLNPTADIDIYFVNNIQGAFGEGFGSNDLFAPMAAFAGNVMIAQGTVGRNTLTHELGHVLLNLDSSVNGGGDEHRLFTIGRTGNLISGAAAPASNVMGTGAAVTRTDLTQAQVLRAQASGFVRFDPP